MKKSIYLFTLVLTISGWVSCHNGGSGSSSQADSATTDSLVEQAQQTVASDTVSHPGADSLNAKSDSGKVKGN